jgi:KUP system potassium uptake protein
MPGVVTSRFRMSAQGDTGPHGGRSRLLPLTLTALGVVYGDIGTSPLYAIRESFFGSHAVPPTHENVLGVLSFVLYALLLIISISTSSSSCAPTTRAREASLP